MLHYKIIKDQLIYIDPNRNDLFKVYLYSMPLGKIVVLIFCMVILLQCKPDNPCQERISYANVKLNEHINLDSLFIPPDLDEIDEIIQEWQNECLHADSLTVVKSIPFHINRQLDIVAHYHEGMIHYGALIWPVSYKEGKKYAQLLYADGLDQLHPVIRLDHHFIIQRICRDLPNYFVFIPSFRGQSLNIGNHFYCSDGFFGDAFDGATTDALRFMQVCEELIVQEKILSKGVMGISRGGTVALLMAIRYPEIDYFVCQSGPTNFLDNRAYDKHTFQYKYQFLGRSTDLSAIRRNILCSSPHYFISYIHQKGLWIQGEQDKIVEIYQMKEAQSLIQETLVEFRTHSSGHKINDMNYITKWIQNVEE